MSRRSAYSVAAFSLGLFSVGAWAQTGPDLPPSSVDHYRAESHYGPDVAVLNPLFPLDDKVELSVGAAYSPISSLMNYEALTGSLVYHINERHSIEPLYFGYAWGSMTDFDRQQLRDREPNSALNAKLGIEIPKYIFAASYLFSPYYAKMHITAQTVAHFDVYFGAGLGLLHDQETFLNGSVGASVTRPALSVAAGMRFMMPSRWAVRLELRNFVQEMKNLDSSAVTNTMQIALSTSIFFGAFPDRSSP